MRLLHLLWFLPLLSCSLSAQDRAAVNGTVTDATGAVVASAAVVLESPDNGLRREIQTNGAGIYEIGSLPVGSYVLSIKKPGFKPFEARQIDLLFGQSQTIDAKLDVGNLSDAVEVTATVGSAEPSNAEIGGVVEAPQIREIPIDGRNWATLMTLAPGAINTGDGAQRSIRFNGHSLDDSNFTFDGIDTSGVQEQTQKADTRLNVSLDSIQEFRVSSAVYTAESGATAGSQLIRCLKMRGGFGFVLFLHTAVFVPGIGRLGEVLLQPGYAWPVAYWGEQSTTSFNFCWLLC